MISLEYRSIDHTALQMLQQHPGLQAPFWRPAAPLELEAAVAAAVSASDARVQKMRDLKLMSHPSLSILAEISAGYML
jgi:hypothetical protein